MIFDLFLDKGKKPQQYNESSSSTGSERVHKKKHNAKQD